MGEEDGQLQRHTDRGDQQLFRIPVAYPSFSAVARLDVQRANLFMRQYLFRLGHRRARLSAGIPFSLAYHLIHPGVELVGVCTG